jgi:tRNA(Ile)-lysidine synthase
MRLISAVSGVQVPAPPPFFSADKLVTRGKSSLADRVLRTVRRHGLFDRGARVVVALSGGSDSVALLHVLRELEPGGFVTVAGVAHFNHQLRGDAADADEAFCRALAARLGLPIEVGRADIRSLARDQGRSVEDAARAARYAFLAEAADRLRAEVVAIAQTRDDQAETFLLRLIRGAGPRGLTGIHPRAGRSVRPLIDISRAELRSYVAERGLDFREDETNRDVAIPRNRVRHELIPYLEREFSPGIVDVLAREAAIARDDEERLHTEAIDLARTVVLMGSNNTVEVDTAGLTSLAPALASRVARIALTPLAAGRFVGFDHVEALLEFARSGAPGSALSLPGQQVRHQGVRVLLRPEPPRVGGDATFFRIPLSIPGEVTLSAQGWAISAALLEAAPLDGGFKARGNTVAVEATALRLPLWVRSRRPGDRFKPLGLGGAEKKLQDFLVDRKVAREQRDALPLVVDESDRIVWVVGQSVSEDFRVTEPSRGVILLKARQLGGAG